MVFNKHVATGKYVQFRTVKDEFFDDPIIESHEHRVERIVQDMLLKVYDPLLTKVRGEKMKSFP